MITHDETPDERLTTTTASGARIYLYPADVKGKYRQLRNILYDILLVIFLILPWIYIKGEPVLLLDVPHRKFHIFGLSFWGHDAPILFFVFLIIAATILLMTALFGRLWCGWGCPQTVFVDRVYRRIERWIEGSAAKRERLAKGPWTAEKLYKRSLKWTLYTIASMIIAHSFLAYFVGVEPLREMVTQPPSENPKSFFVMLFMMLLVLFDYGWFREQFCLIACPYGRFQSVLMDEHSLIVTYDEKRGEPRKGTAKENLGDCVSCNRCVQVCPTGIDIRKGVQMECIACTACVDACNTVMGKIKKPLGLIRYDTEQGLLNKPTKWIRLRVVIYSVILCLGIFGLTYAVSQRELLKVNFVRSTENPYQLINNGQGLINHFKMNVRNQYEFPIFISFDVALSVSDREEFKITMPINPLEIKTQDSVRGDIFISFNRAFIGEGVRILPIQGSIFKDRDRQNKLKTLNYEVPLIGP